MALFLTLSSLARSSLWLFCPWIFCPCGSLSLALLSLWIFKFSVTQINILKWLSFSSFVLGSIFLVDILSLALLYLWVFFPWLDCPYGFSNFLQSSWCRCDPFAPHGLPLSALSVFGPFCHFVRPVIWCFWNPLFLTLLFLSLRICVFQFIPSIVVMNYA